MKSIRALWPLRCLPTWLWLLTLPLIPCFLGRAEPPTNPASPPVILIQPRDLALAAADYARFEVVASGSVPLSYQWQTVATNRLTVTNVVDGTNLVTTTNVIAAINIDGATLSAYTLYGITTNSPRGFRVVITNQAAAVTSVVASLSVMPVAARQLLASSMTSGLAGRWVVPIQFYPLGDERHILGSLAFDPEVLLHPQLRRAPALTNVELTVDDTFMTNGRVGMTFLVPDGIVAGTTTLTAADILDLPSLANKLKNRSDGVSSFVYDQLSSATRNALSYYQGAASDPRPVQITLVPDLNLIIAGPNIYDQGRFSEVVLRADTQKLLAENPTGTDLARLNRLLLEDAYPLELARNPNPLAGITTIAEFTFDLAPDRQIAEAALAWVNLPRPLQVRDATNGVLDFNAVVIPAVLKPERPPVLDPQTGLYTQSVVVVNPAATDTRGARLSVNGLGRDSLTNLIRLANAAGSGITYTNGTTVVTVPPYFDAGAIPAGGVRLLTAEYYVSDRRTIPTPSFEVTVTQPTLLNPLGTNYIKVDRALYTNDVFLVEFNTLSNYLYYVQYNWTIVDTNAVWKTAVPAVRGTGGRVQWMDNGPPKSERLPPGNQNRYYRVLGP